MGLPPITHLQFLVLNSLANGERSGAELREDLGRNKVRLSGPAFYQAMSRLEESGFVKGRYEQKTIKGQAIKLRHYKILADGLRACAETQRFYVQAALDAGQGGLVYA